MYAMCTRYATQTPSRFSMLQFTNASPPPPSPSPSTEYTLKYHRKMFFEYNDIRARQKHFLPRAVVYSANGEKSFFPLENKYDHRNGYVNFIKFPIYFYATTRTTDIPRYMCIVYVRCWLTEREKTSYKEGGVF